MATRPIAPPTIADVSDQIPNLAPASIGGNPIEDPASLHQLFGAASSEAQRDNSTADDVRILHGYQPIVSALGLDPTENPGQFDQLDAASQARFGTVSRLSKLATAAGVGEELPFTHNRMADRGLQETLIAQEIQRRRSTQPNFLPGVPDTVDGLHKYFLANEAKASAADQATLARSPGGIVAGAVQFGGSTAGTFHDPLNVAALAIPGGEAKGLLQVAARDALINGLVELGETPIAAHNRHELGQSYTVGDAAWNVASAAAGGAILGPAMHAGGKVAGKVLAPVSDKINEAVMALAARGMQIHLDPKLPIDQALAELDNRQLVALHRQMAGEGATPDEKAAANTLERSADVAESSPYQPGPAGDGTHDGQLADSINEILNNRRPTDPPPPPPAAPASGDPGARAPTTAPERPPAGTSTLAARPQPGDTEATIASFQGKVGHAENNTGNVNAKNPRSSASGPAQFTDPTFRDYYRKVYGEDPGAHPAQELKNNPEVQARLLERLTRDHAATLENIREPVTEGNLYLMHVLGGGDGPKVLKADPDMPIERILPAGVIDANPQFRGKSASEVIAWAHKKMGGAASSVPVRDAAGTIEAASEDPLTAQLNAEALALEPQIIGATRLPDGSPVNLYTRNVPSSEIGVDATRFQFKGGGDEFGVTDRLKGVREWDPGLAGRVTLWEDPDNKLWIADGHQRHGLARRIGAENGTDIPLDAMILRSADGVTAEDARVWAALKNIAEGTGSMVDAAKVLRDAGEHALDRLPPKSPLVRDGAALARLSDDAFGAVYNERIPADQAAVIGHLLPDNPETHAGMVDLLIKTDPANRAQAQSIVRQAIAAGFHKEEQIDLFGAHSSVASLFAEKAKILERGLARLRKMRLVHNTAAAEADTLEQAGSKIAIEQSKKEAQANAEAIAMVDRLAYRAGPVADALDVAARELAAGGKLTDATRQFIEHVRGLDLASLGREAPVVDGGGASVDGVGRGGDGGEADAPLFAEPGDPPQPTLSELEKATERFSNPDGPAVKQQAESLEHDFKAWAARVEAIPVPTSIDKVLEGQRGADLEDLLARAADNQKEIGKIGPELAAASGAEFVDPGAKSRERVLAKASAYPDPGEIKDLARGGFLVTEISQGDKIKAELEARGFTVHDKGWKPNNGYADRKLIVAFPNGGVGEIQIIPKVLSDYKFGEGHKLYELVSDPKTPPAEAEAALVKMKAGYEERLAGTDFEAIGKAAENSAFESGVPSSNADRTVSTDALRQDPATNTDPVFASSTATARSSSSKNLMIGASSDALDMGEKADPGKVARDRQLAELGAAAAMRAPSDVGQMGEIGLPLMDAHDQFKFRIDDGGEDISAEDLLAELAADKKATDALRGCL